MDTRSNGPQIAVFIDFENMATSAEANIGDFDVTAVIDLLRARGRLLIKRAYGDWGRFHRYRRALLENGIDLIQLYSVGVQQKNRADIRLSLEALETVFTRPHIDHYAIVSGDSDYTELIYKLRDHGKYTIGIGLRAATSDLLRRACDEFIFYDSLVAEDIEDLADELHLPDPRDLLRRALSAAEAKNDIPIPAGRLKQLMLGLDSSFNEANYGYPQFRTFLEAHSDLAQLDDSRGQVYVNPYRPPAAPQARPAPIQLVTGGESGPEPPVEPELAGATPPVPAKPISDPSQRYRNFLRDAGLRLVEFATRQQVIADALAILQASGEQLSLAMTADELQDRYDAGNALAQKIAVPDVMRLLLVSGALTFAGGQPDNHAAIREAASLTLTSLAQACDAAYVWRLVEGGISIQAAHLARALYDATTDADKALQLCHWLVQRQQIAPSGDGYVVAPQRIAAFLERPELADVMASLHKMTLPPGQPVTLHAAENLFREGADLRQKDFASSAQRCLLAARIQLECLRAGQQRAGFDDLKWYIASYCSAEAGHAFVTGNYGAAVPHYLAFFSLAQEADSVWPRIQRLVAPMASYFLAIAGRQHNESVPLNLGRTPAGQVAWRVHNHPNPQVGADWETLVERLAAVNLGIVRQIFRELSSQVAPALAGGSEHAAAIERTRAFLANLIAQREST